MSELRKAAQQMVAAMEANPDAMVEVTEHHWHYTRDLALDALRAALAQPDPAEVRQGWEYMREKGLLQEAIAQPEPTTPVGWFESPHGAFRANPLYKLEFPSQLLAWSVPVYTAPPQRKPLRYVTYVCPICAASLERQE